LYPIHYLLWGALMEYASIEWRDGQPWSRDFDDVYFSVNDGRGESEHVFLQQNDLSTRFAEADRFVIAETGFGTGLNFALTLKLWQEYAPEHAQLDYFAIDFAPLSPADISRVASIWPDLEDCFAAFLECYPLPVAGRHMRAMLNGRVRLHLVFMDVVEALQNESLAVDTWFLDGFSPAKNPQIWNQSVYALLAQNSAPAATLATYSAAGAVRRGLVQAGFTVEKRTGHGNKREMIVARLATASNAQPVTAPWFRLPEIVYAKKQGIVIGAGLAGLAVAWSLIQRGWTITIIDKHADIAAEASGNPSGLVQPRLSVDNSVDTQFYATAFLHALSRLKLLQTAYQTETGKNLWQGKGVYCAIPSKRARQLLNRNQFHADYVRSVEHEITCMPLMPGTDVLQIPSAGWASPKLICDAIQKACGDKLSYVQANISSIHQQESVKGKKWKLMSDEQDVLFETELLVLANGIHATKFMQTDWMPVRSARGQLTRLKLKSDAISPECAFSANHYLAPSLNNDSIYYCGASYDLDDDCAELRESDQNTNWAFAEQCYPGIFQRPTTLDGRTGFRAVSDDRMPIVGPVPDVTWFETEYGDLKHGRPAQNYASASYLQGLYISAAHGSRGMTSCFLAAEIVAAQIEMTPLPVDQSVIEAINPARFIIRRLKRGA
jgi:tRNA 5-methylaminomethyl-2-thiouridine biosynthesis bifunctional protein